jgi:hypothetical protein
LPFIYSEALPLEAKREAKAGVKIVLTRAPIANIYVD